MQAIEGGDLESLKAVFDHLHPSDIADLLENLEAEQIAEIMRILRAPRGIDVFEQLEIEVQSRVLDYLGQKEIVNILEDLSPDDRVDLLQTLPEETVDSLLPMMAQAERQEVTRLLQYEEDTAGSVMTTEYAALPDDITVSEALKRLRTIAPESEMIYYIYLLGEGRRLKGTVSLRDLVLAKPNQVLKDIMSRDPIFVEVSTDQEEVARALNKYDLLALPVVDAQQGLVGIITHDDIMDVLVEEQTEDAHMMGAIEPVEEPYFEASIWSLTRKRGVWLFFLFIGQFFTAWALEHYQGTFENALALIFFIPLILSSGGNTGSQSVTLITRAMAIGEVHVKDFFKVVLRESTIGVALGVFLGLVGFTRAALGSSTWHISVTVGLAIIFVVIAGALAGASLPLLFKRLGFDPAIMSGPFVTSVVDVIGIIIYFGMAQFLLFS